MQATTFGDILECAYSATQPLEYLLCRLLEYSSYRQVLGSHGYERLWAEAL